MTFSHIWATINTERIKRRHLMYQVILFDLDGTLIDSEYAITKSVSHVLRTFGFPEKDLHFLRRFIGPPLAYSFSEFCGLSPEDTETAVARFREYFSEHAIYENPPFEGVESVLKTLKENGKTLALATSKYEPFAKRILEHIGFSQYFTFTAGSLADGSRALKKDVIEYVLETLGVTDRSLAVMIGDRKHDTVGACEAGIDSIGVLYGFGSYEELTANGATHIAKTPDAILDIIKK